jgi:hypothetical protein
MDNNPDKINGALQAINVLDSEQSSLIDMRDIAKRFVRQRLTNSSTVEDIKKLALTKLQVKLNDEDTKLSTGMLLDIIDTLDKSSKEDINTILKTQADAGKPAGSGGGGGNNVYYNMFFSSEDETQKGVKPAINHKDFAVIQQLVIASEAVINKNIKS